jgi:hypothetical protein
MLAGPRAGIFADSVTNVTHSSPRVPDNGFVPKPPGPTELMATYRNNGQSQDLASVTGPAATGTNWHHAATTRPEPTRDCRRHTYGGLRWEYGVNPRPCSPAKIIRAIRAGTVRMT